MTESNGLKIIQNTKNPCNRFLNLDGSLAISMEPDLYLLPKVTGVYIFRDFRGPLYIGISKNIQSRIKQHFVDKNNNYKLTNLILNPVKQLYVSYVKTASLRQAQEFEKALISFLKPKGNTLLKNNGGTYG